MVDWVWVKGIVWDIELVEEFLGIFWCVEELVGMGFGVRFLVKDDLWRVSDPDGVMFLVPDGVFDGYLEVLVIHWGYF